MGKDISIPGEFPFTRGIYKDMYRGRLWTMRQYAGFGTAFETNKRFHYLLSHGNTGLSVAFDLPTQMGYDSDAKMAEGEVGRTGVAISSLSDMETLFHKIPLDKVSTSMTINSTAAILLAGYLCIADSQGITYDKLNGTVQNDMLKEFAARGTYIFPPKPSLRLAIDLIEYCTKNVPKWNPISISGYHMREAGCTAVQEAAFTIANGLAYVEEAFKRGLDINEFGARLSFFFASHNDFIEEIAKFRAARRLWAQLMRERYNANDRACMLRFHCQTAGSTLTSKQPHNNMVRVSIQALAAVLGGAQSLHSNGFDEALALPTEESVRTALRTQQVIAYESGVINTADPCGGAFEIEKATDRIEEEALVYIKKIEDMGGALAAIEKEFIQQEISNAAYQHQKDVEAKKKIVVGVNDYIIKEEKLKNLHKHDPKVEKKQISGLEKLKRHRNKGEALRTLKNLETCAKVSNKNLVPPIIDAVKAYATLGEIIEVLKRCQQFRE